ncbi:MAG: hypothetical protein C3F08_01995 [Candidatus Methylomirabilota bacterium]|nr:MAG: hypothetical protein C3F08_01995 [candidate division NC10 bacterium]
MKRCFLALLVAATFLVGCGSIQEHSKLAMPVDRTLRTGPGGVVFRIERSRDLANIYGRADLWGRKIDTGYEELRYVGLSDDGQVVFRFREQQILSNETTLTQMGGLAAFGAQGSTAAATAIGPAQAHIQVLPPQEVEFKHDFARKATLEYAGVRILILGATPSELTYALEKPE